MTATGPATAGPVLRANAAPSRPQPATLSRLAQAAGVAVQYEAGGANVTPPATTLRAVLEVLGHPCESEDAARRSLRAFRHRPWVRPVDPVVVRWQDATGPSYVSFSVPHDVTPDLALTLEDGTTRELPAPVWGGVLGLEHGARRRGWIALPLDLPLGYHHLSVTVDAQVDDCTVIVAPETCPDPGTARRWGWMVQAYALRSRDSWGQGEFRDLGGLASWSATQGADFVLINPVHAPAPTLPQQPSPYSPTSRRFVNPCYLHIPDVDTFADLPADEQRALRTLPPELRPDSPRIDRDRIWQTKRAALQRLFERMGPSHHEELAAYRREQGAALERFATFCALAEVHGQPFDEWPADLRDPRTDTVARWAEAHADHVALHAWLQLLCDRQMAAAQERARQAGMAIGLIHDLAVGVEPLGADVWSLPDEIARRISVGAPPDAFNPQGQNWAQPPLLPDALRANGYRTLRELLRASLRAGGGLRLDHILGLSRLFWIPDGAGPADGTYVRYPADEQFAVLALEAHRAGAIVIGEDLGTVDERIRRLMRRRGVASSAVLYFEHADGRPHPAASYPRRALASVTTHDLPTATGFWDGSALDIRADLGLLARTVATERRHLEDQQESLVRTLIEHGCLGAADPDVRHRVLAMHRFLAASPTILVACALWDAVGDPRPPNVPGTVDEYPNWRLPLTAPTPEGPRPITLEDLPGSAPVRAAVAALQRG